MKDFSLEMEPDVYRIWVCQECHSYLADEELRRHVASGGWGHPCPDDKGTFCESYLMPYMDNQTPVEEKT